MDQLISAQIFKLKSPCVDCPFRKVGGIRHGSRVLEYAAHFLIGVGSTFPCHRSVPETDDRSEWGSWLPGQQMCAGGLILAEHVGQRSRTVQYCIDVGAHDPKTLEDRDTVFESVRDLFKAQIKPDD